MSTGAVSHLECRPEGTSEDTIQYYTVPIGSNANKTIVQNTGMLMFMNFAVFSIVLGLIYVLMPFLYQKLVVREMIFSGGSATDIAKKIVAVDWAIIIWSSLSIFLIGISSFSDQFKDNGDSELQTSAIALTAIFLLSKSLIEAMKRNDPKFLHIEGMTDLTYELLQKTSPDISIFNFMSNDTTQKSIVCWAIAIFIYTIIFFPLYNTNDVKYKIKDRKSLITAPLIYMLSLPVITAFVIIVNRQNSGYTIILPNE